MAFKDFQQRIVIAKIINEIAYVPLRKLTVIFIFDIHILQEHFSHQRVFNMIRIVFQKRKNIEYFRNLLILSQLFTKINCKSGEFICGT